MILAITNRFHPACLARCGWVGVIRARRRGRGRVGCGEGARARAAGGWIVVKMYDHGPPLPPVQGVVGGLVALEEEEAVLPFARDSTDDS